MSVQKIVGGASGGPVDRIELKKATDKSTRERYGLPETATDEQLSAALKKATDKGRIMQQDGYNIANP